MATALLDALPVALLGALIGLDFVSFPQAMISRPLVSATAAGALLGRPADGLLAGVVLELIALETLPFGAARYPEWGSAGVVGGAVYASQPPGSAGALPVAVLAALATAMLSGRSMVLLRQADAARIRSVRDEVARGSVAAVNSVQIFGLTADLVRGFLVTLLAFAILNPIARAAVGAWGVDAMGSRAVVAAVAASVGGGAIWKIFHTTARAGWLFLLGLAGGALVLLLR